MAQAPCVAGARRLGYRLDVSSPETTPLSAAGPGPLRPVALAGRLAGGILALFGLVGLVSYLFREPLIEFGNTVVQAGGILGIGLIVVVLDPLPGLGFFPGLMVGTAGHLDSAPLFVVTIAASWVSSALGWALGHFGGKWGLIRWTLHATGALAIVTRWGARSVALTSVTPLPYGLATVAAGAAGVPLQLFMLAATARWLKIALSLLAIRAGWSIGGA